MDLPVRDPNGIAEAQTTGGAANLVLNGALCDPGTALQFDIADSYPDSVAGVRLRWGSATEGVNLTFTGKDDHGNTISEVISGAAGSPAVDTVQFYSQVTVIAASGAIAVNTTVGDSHQSVSKTVPLNWRAYGEPPTYVIFEPDGDVAGTIQEYFGDIQSQPLSTDGWITKHTMAEDTAVATEGTPHARAVRVVVATAGSEFQFGVIQN